MPWLQHYINCKNGLVAYPVSAASQHSEEGLPYTFNDILRKRQAVVLALLSCQGYSHTKTCTALLCARTNLLQVDRSWRTIMKYTSCQYSTLTS